MYINTPFTPVTVGANTLSDPNIPKTNCKNKLQIELSTRVIRKQTCVYASHTRDFNLDPKAKQNKTKLEASKEQALLELYSGLSVPLALPPMSGLRPGRTPVGP